MNDEDKEINRERDEKKVELMSKENQYIAVRMIELVFAASFFFGIMWSGVGKMQISIPGFLTLYGGAGALICEFFARRLNPNVSYEENDE